MSQILPLVALLISAVMGGHLRATQTPGQASRSPARPPRGTGSPSSGGAGGSVINVVEAFGARGDLVHAAATGSMTKGSSVLTMSAVTFGPSDAGKYIVVQAASGGTPSELASTIRTVTSPTTAILAAAAGATVSGGVVTYGTDNTDAFTSALKALQRRQVLYVPAGMYFTGPLVNATAWSRIIGDQWLATVLVPKSNMTNDSSVVWFQTDISPPALPAKTADQEISDISIQNVAGVQFPGTGIRWQALSRELAGGQTRRVWTSGMQPGIVWHTVYTPIVQDVVAENSPAAGLVFYASRFVTVVGCEFFQNGEEAVQFVWDGSTRQMGFSFIGNKVIQSGKSGLLVSGTDQVSIIGNQFDGSSRGDPGKYSNIEIQNCANGVISGNGSSDELGLAPTKYGIALDAKTSGFYLGGNQMHVGLHRSGSAINDAGSNNTVIEGQTNRLAGYVALNSGSVSLSNGLNSNIAIPINGYVKVSGPTAAFQVGGFTGGVDGRILVLRNPTPHPMTIVLKDAHSNAANRIHTMTGGNVLLAGGHGASATFIYDASLPGWVLLSHNP